MLKSSPIFKRNGVHLVKKKTFKKKTRIVYSQGLSVLNMQKHFLFVSNFDHVNFAIREKYSIIKMTIQTIMLHLCDLSNIQKNNFKECPLTWVVSLTMFLPSSSFRKT
jgi:hypothetical protein